MQEVCIDPQIKTESLIPLQTVILGNQQMNTNNAPPQQNGQQQQQHPVLNQPPTQPKMGTNCDKSRAAENAYWMPTETGFINSQPSMAEFLTHLGPDSSPKMDQTPYGNSSEDPVPEYPWMKEKKTARKNNTQSEFLIN
ncbi:CLUMA_CG002309, isoform A [Clunio marinus]|uniref:CLUMA_CG002309, isoform A n=1 Tax=Clunio marinus TaxID=568069 RepID=A0A1J1HK66_9DIPT|nr:CLUMA_CG002309, isoform A [Clunio marinus]